jgi:putative ABC transport system permease protein
MMRSFAALQQVRPGFDPSAVLTLRLAFPQAKYATPESRYALRQLIESRIRELRGVADVGFISQLPLTGSGPLSPYAYNEETARNWESETSDGRNVSAAYFRAMGTRLIAGRFFDEHDKPVQGRIIVDETLAARAWPGENPVGKHLQVQPTGSPNPFAEVVGVVEHIRAHDLVRPVRPQIYTVLGGGAGRMYAVVRTADGCSCLAPQIRSVIQRIDPDLPVDKVRGMSEYVSDALASSRLTLMLMSLFGTAALLLSSVGIYGVFSYSVSQRTREIGIRMALGQEPGRIRNLVLAEGLRLIAISTAIGAALAFVLTQSVSSLLYGVQATDPSTFGLMALLLIVVGLAGCYVPALRATRVNPIVALRAD